MDHLDYEVLDPKDYVHDTKKVNKFYDKLRKQITKWVAEKGVKKELADILLFAPDFFVLLARMVKDSRVKFKTKTAILGALAYFMLPFDFLPELIMGPLGYGDDLLLAVYVVNSVLNEDKALVVDNWSGNESVLEVVQRIVSQANQLVNSNVLAKVKGLFNKLSR